jgi:hypothetical protein
MEIHPEHFKSSLAPEPALTTLTPPIPPAPLSSQEEKLNKKKIAAPFLVQS